MEVNMDTKKLIMDLSDLRSPSGFEDEMAPYLSDTLGDQFHVEDDNIRNTYVYENHVSLSSPNPQKLRIMLDAHADECGYIISAIKKTGLLKFLPLGSMIPGNAVAGKVRVKNTDGDYIQGIITSTPVHFLTQEQQKQTVEWEQLYIDVGATSEEELRKVFKIEVGAPVVPDVTCTYIEENQVFMGKAFDDRIGVAMAVEVMQKLKGNVQSELIGAISTQEEVGGRGVKVSVNKVAPHLAIVFEGTPADDSFAASDEAQSCLRKGPQIRHMDRTTISHPRFTKMTIDLAKKLNIPLQRAVRSGGGTNAQFIHNAHLGIPTIVLATPVRYIHTHHCIVTLEDFNHGVDLAVALIKEIDKQGLDLLKQF